MKHIEPLCIYLYMPLCIYPYMPEEFVQLPGSMHSRCVCTSVIMPKQESVEDIWAVC